MTCSDAGSRRVDQHLRPSDYCPARTEGEEEAPKFVISNTA